MELINNFSRPLPGQFHYCFTQRYPQWLKVRENNNPRKRTKTENEAGHFMDSKENKLHYFTQLELLRLKVYQKFWRRAISKVLKITSSAHRVVWRAQRIQGWYRKQTTVLKYSIVYLYCALLSKGRHRSSYNKGFFNYNKFKKKEIWTETTKLYGIYYFDNNYTII